MLLYLGNEGPIDEFYNFTGAMFEHAMALKALVVFVEHRYYGKSQPYGSNPSQHDLRELTVEQAMADYAWFIQTFRHRQGCLRDKCPVVTFGGSYGGMLVAWFRQKYPQLTVGGVGCGAVIDFYSSNGRQTAFWNATMHTFKEFGKVECPCMVDEKLKSMRVLASSKHGRRVLQEQFHSCEPLEEEDTAGEKLEFFTRGVLSSLAMLDYTEPSAFVTPLPANPVAVACAGLVAEKDGLDSLKNVLDLYLNATGNFQCYDFLAEIVGRPTDGHLRGPVMPADMGHWQYQACTELPLQTLASDNLGFFVAADSQLSDVAAACRMRYGVTPRPAWLPLSLGGSDLRVGNLFFTDGEKDPWRTGSIRLDKVKPGIDIQHLVIPGAAHHEDLRFDSQPPRPQVQNAKLQAREAMKRWITSGAMAIDAPAAADPQRWSSVQSLLV